MGKTINENETRPKQRAENKRVALLAAAQAASGSRVTDQYILMVADRFLEWLEH